MIMLSFSMREKWGVGVIAAAVTLVGAGAWAHRSQSAGEARPAAVAPVNADGSVEIPAGEKASGEASAVQPAPAAPAQAAPPTAVEQTAKLTVFVTGAVKQPGVYTLKPGDRIYHAVRAAGGFKASAQKDSLNLADKVADSDQISVPTRAEVAAAEDEKEKAAPAPAPQPETPAAKPTEKSPAKEDAKAAPAKGRVLGKQPLKPRVTTLPGAGGAKTEGEAKTASKSKSGGSAKFKNPGDGLVNINTAGVEELQKLPGVGPSTAEKIVEYRKEISQFTDIKQMMDVTGLRMLFVKGC